MDERRGFSPNDEVERIRYSAKAQLRSKMRALRGHLPDRAREARSKSICDTVVQLPCFIRARSVIGYVAILKEVDPEPILKIAFKCGKTVGLPRVDQQNQMLAIHRWSQGEPLIKSAFGVKEPFASAPLIEPSQIDLVLVPALAFDPRGYRIGYGKGFYDRLLGSLSGAKAVGIAYDFQLIIEAPNTAGDLPVSVIVTDQRTLLVDRVDTI
ncbi:MAG: 5-formyltetrahydrofolate cyclo-ligase [Deltaproteobacteria bacterium]|nr:5-formyltetrahydrofolate cyclo-ligase [Deltaproteobacteria bacterium]